MAFEPDEQWAVHIRMICSDREIDKLYGSAILQKC